jgi:hypothetical protein
MRTLLSSLALLTLSCSAALPTAELGEHPKDDYVVVEYPPPPAKVEEPGEAPNDECVWVDGYWQYIGRRWEWRSGEWVRPPSSCRLAPARIAWEEVGAGGPTTNQGTSRELRYRPPRWYPEGQALVNVESACPSPPVCGGSSPAKSAKVPPP